MKSRGRIANRLICSKRERSRLTASTISLATRLRGSCSRARARPLRTSARRASRARRCTAAGRRRRAPARSNRDAFRSFSMFCGATFLPPAVTRMSFLRSVMRQEPVVVDRRRCRRCGASRPRRAPARRRLVLVVAGEDRLLRMQDLAVVGDAELEARAAPARRCRSGTRSGRLTRARRRALGQAVALEDEDVERVEELRDLLGERRAAGDAEAQPAAEPLLAPSRRRAGRRARAAQASAARDGLARAAAARSPRWPTRERPVDQPPLRRRSPRRTARRTARVHLLVHARDARQHRRPDGRQRLADPQRVGAEGES